MFDVATSAISDNQRNNKQVFIMLNETNFTEIFFFWFLAEILQRKSITTITISQYYVTYYEKYEIVCPPSFECEALTSTE